MLEIINKKINNSLFNRVSKKVLKTPPIKATSNENVIIVSQVYSNALYMTLLAIKSFLLHFGDANVELIDDGSLTKSDKDILKKHLLGCKIIPIGNIDIGKCPKGGTWERLIHIISKSQHNFVIQIDTDTLTIGPIPEIYNAVNNNTSFTIGSPMWPREANIQYLNSLFSRKNIAHVQQLGEIELINNDNYNLDSGYIRGCSAYTGFAQGIFNFDDLERFSVQMEQTLGSDKWHEWGSEQFSSNVVISSDKNASILPWPKFQNYNFPHDNGSIQGRVSAIHFIGSNRYDHRIYEKLSSQVINNLHQIATLGKLNET